MSNSKGFKSNPSRENFPSDSAIANHMQLTKIFNGAESAGSRNGDKERREKMAYKQGGKGAKRREERQCCKGDRHPWRQRARVGGSCYFGPKRRFYGLSNVWNAMLNAEGAKLTYSWSKSWCSKQEYLMIFRAEITLVQKLMFLCSCPRSAQAKCASCNLILALSYVFFNQCAQFSHTFKRR